MMPSTYQLGEGSEAWRTKGADMLGGEGSMESPKGGVRDDDALRGEFSFQPSILVVRKWKAKWIFLRFQRSSRVIDSGSCVVAVEGYLVAASGLRFVALLTAFRELSAWFYPYLLR